MKGTASPLPPHKPRAARRSRPASGASESPQASLLERVLTWCVYPAVVAGVLLALTVRLIKEPDCWFHMALGRYFFEHGSLPRTDIFSFTGQGNEWVSSGWVPSLFMHRLYETFGAAGLELMTFGVVVAAYLAIYFVAAAKYGNRGTMALVLMGCMLMAYLRFSPRPENFSQLFMAAAMLLLLTADSSPRAAQGRVPRRLWLLPPLFAVWANFHPGFMAGLIALGLYCAAQGAVWIYRRGPVRQLLPLLPCALCFFTWMLNPYHYRLVTLATKVESTPGVKEHILEWKPLFSDPAYALPPATYLGVLLVSALFAVVVLARREGVPVWHKVLGAGFLLLMFYQRRHAGMAAIVLPVLLIPHVSRWERLLNRRQLALPAAIFAAAAALVFAQHTGRLQVGRGLFVRGVDAGLLPVLSVNYLRENRPPGNMFNTYGPGGYLLYHLGPETKVFIDGRLDVYDPQIWKDFLAIQNDRIALDEAIDRYGLKTFVVYTKDNPDNPAHLVNRLTARPDWKLVHFDDAYAVFVRETPETADYTASRAFRYVTPYAPERLVKALKNDSSREQALEEIRRADLQSARSATSLVLAALSLRELGDTNGMHTLLNQAAAAWPRSPLLRRFSEL